jgi:hypothetical protein
MEYFPQWFISCLHLRITQHRLNTKIFLLPLRSAQLSSEGKKKKTLPTATYYFRWSPASARLPFSSGEPVSAPLRRLRPLRPFSTFSTQYSHTAQDRHRTFRRTDVGYSWASTKHKQLWYSNIRHYIIRKFSTRQTGGRIYSGSI